MDFSLLLSRLCSFLAGLPKISCFRSAVVCLCSCATFTVLWQSQHLTSKSQYMSLHCFRQNRQLMIRPLWSVPDGWRDHSMTDPVIITCIACGTCLKCVSCGLESYQFIVFCVIMFCAQLASMIYVRQKVNPMNPYASNWLERLRRIRQLHERLSAERAKANPTIGHSLTSKPCGDFTDFVK